MSFNFPLAKASLPKKPLWIPKHDEKKDLFEEDEDFENHLADVWQYETSLVKLGFMKADGEPLRCFDCGHDVFKEEGAVGDGRGVVEFDSVCKNCGEIVAHWAYGQWYYGYLGGGNNYQIILDKKSNVWYNGSMEDKHMHVRGANNRRTPNKVELEKINLYTRHRLSANNVWSFDILLCNNAVDRDGERFTLETLTQMLNKVVGVSGHFSEAPYFSMRIYQAWIQHERGELVAENEPLASLWVKAYVERIPKNEELIAKLMDSVEVSISCSVRTVECSICSKPFNHCCHKKGKLYENVPCHHRLIGFDEFYEFLLIKKQPHWQSYLVESAVTINEQMGLSRQRAFSCIGKRILLDKSLPYDLAKIENEFKSRCAAWNEALEYLFTGNIVRPHGSKRILKENMSTVIRVLFGIKIEYVTGAACFTVQTGNDKACLLNVPNSLVLTPESLRETFVRLLFGRSVQLSYENDGVWEESVLVTDYEKEFWSNEVFSPYVSIKGYDLFQHIVIKPEELKFRLSDAQLQTELSFEY